MTDNQTYYKLSNKTLTQSEITNITEDVQIINRDWSNITIPITIKMNEMAKYYTDQGFSRSYAIQASYVVLNQDDLNGNVANLNIGDYYNSIGQEFTEKTRLTVSYYLINNDYKLLTQQNYIIPNENEITDEHVQVFKQLSIPITYWGGSIFAQNNVNFVSGITNIAEINHSEYMSNYMPNNNSIDDITNLIKAFTLFVFSKGFQHTSSNLLPEFSIDAINLLKAITVAGVEFGINSITSTEDIENGTLNIQDSNGNNLLSITSKNNAVSYNVGNLSNISIGSIQTIQDNKSITLAYNNNILSSITSVNSNGNKYVTSLMGNNILINGKSVSTQEVADAFNQYSLLDKISSLMGISSKQVDPIIVTLSGVFNIKQLSTLDDYKTIDETSTKYLAQSLGDSTYYLVTVGDNDQPVFYNEDNLATLDGNNDGIIDLSDTAFNNLRLWNPSTGDFTSDNVLTLNDAGITSINIIKNAMSLNNNGATQTGQYVTNNSNILVGSFNLNYSTLHTITNKDQSLSDGSLSSTINVTNQDGSLSNIDLSSLPNLHGYGVLSSLEASTITINADGSQTLNNALYQDIRTLSLMDLDTSYTNLTGRFDILLHDWELTGTLYDGNGDILPEQKMNNNYYLQFIDKYLGEATYFYGHESYLNYGPTSREFLNEAYNESERNLISEFFIQSQLKDIQTYISYDVKEDIFTSQTSYADLLTYVDKTYANMSSDSSLYYIISNIIYSSSVSQDISLFDLYNDMSTVNPDQAAQMIMTGEGINIENDNENKMIITASTVGGKTYIWTGNINEEIDYPKYSSAFYSKSQDNLIINSNINEALFTINSSNIIITYNNHSLYLDNVELDNMSEINFKDKVIYSMDNALRVGNISFVQGDTSELNDVMYGVSMNATITYDFSQNVNITSLQDTTVNLVFNKTLTTADIIQNNDNTFSITENGYTITFNEDNSDILLKQNNKNITYLFDNHVMQSYKTHSGSSQTIISSEGIYAYDPSTINNKISVTNTSGTDTIYMSGYNSGTRETLDYTPGKTVKTFQTSLTDIQIQSDDLTINLKNVMGDSTENYYNSIYTDLFTINDKYLTSYEFNCIQTPGILETGYYGYFTDTLNPDVSDVEIRCGTYNKLTDSDGHDIFIESLNGKITKDNTEIIIDMTSDNTFGTGNVYSLLYNFSLSGTYEKGNIVFTSNNHKYTIMSASDFYNHLTLTFEYNGTRSSFSLGSSNINYNVTNGTFIANELSRTNTINLLGENANVEEINVGNNVYNILNNGNFIVTNKSNIDNSDVFNITTQANLEINGFTNGRVVFSGVSTQYTMSEDYKHDLIISGVNGSTTQIDNYYNFNGTIRFSDQTINTSEMKTVKASSSITVSDIIKSEYLTLSGSYLTIDYKDNNATTLIDQRANNSKEVFNTHRQFMLVSDQNDYGNDITVNMYCKQNLNIENVSYSNVLFNGVSISFDYAWKGSKAPLGTSHMTINNAVNYFGSQDSLKIYLYGDDVNTFADITKSLNRTLLSEKTDTTITTSHNKISLDNNLVLTDNGNDNEIMLSNNQETISVGANDRLLIDNSTIQNTAFHIENGVLEILIDVRKYALLNIQSYKNAMDVNANISLSDGNTISMQNAFTFAQDYDSMKTAGSSMSSHIIDMVGQKDYLTLTGLYNH